MVYIELLVLVNEYTDYEQITLYVYWPGGHVAEVSVDRECTLRLKQSKLPLLATNYIYRTVHDTQKNQYRTPWTNAARRLTLLFRCGPANFPDWGGAVDYLIPRSATHNIILLLLLEKTHVCKYCFLYYLSLFGVGWLIVYTCFLSRFKIIKLM